ncbi:MAG: hypothetical protein GWN29_12900 [Gammaproteobacteria bacterium]|nr:hypothetical protein [Gammaproteobacteria bacterium]
MELDSVVMPAQRDDSVIPEVSSEVAALPNAVDAHREVDVFALELLGLDEHVRLARFAIAKEREEAVDTIALSCDVCDRLRAILFIRRVVVLSARRHAHNEARECERHPDEGVDSHDVYLREGLEA